MTLGWLRSFAAYVGAIAVVALAILERVRRFLTSLHRRSGHYHDLVADERFAELAGPRQATPDDQNWAPDSTTWDALEVEPGDDSDGPRL